MAVLGFGGFGFEFDPRVVDGRHLTWEAIMSLDIEHFFRSYNQAQGREFKISGRGEPQPAQTMLRAAMRQSEKSRGG